MSTSLSIDDAITIIIAFMRLAKGTQISFFTHQSFQSQSDAYPAKLHPTSCVYIQL